MTISSDELRARSLAAIKNWQLRLLDLSKRNRALNFKPSKVSTVTVVDEQPIEVFRHLCLEGRTMRFRPTLPSVRKTNGPEPGSDLPPLNTSVQTDDEDEAPKPMELDFAPYDGETVDERHRDDMLQCLATPEALDKSLRRLDEQARATIEEQGVNVLFLALGMLHYTESADSSEVLRAPLVMVPVRLSRKSARSGYVIEASDDDPLVNPALTELLRREFAIDLPPLSNPGGDDPDLDALHRFYGQAARIAAERVASGMAGWAVKTDIFLGMFSFQKLVMFKDLEANTEAFASHHMVRQLISRIPSADTPVMGLPADVREMQLDKDFAPESTAQVVDADSSQLRAIAAVSRGHPLVLEGPPGTGKSQTITNLIAQALAEGKSVLFVAEKMAALQVVHSRLVSAGLGEFCLELHASKANKRAVMHELKASLDASLQQPPIARATQRLPVVRAELSEYVRAVHTPGGTLGLSPFAAIGMLDAVINAPRVSLAKSLANITLEQMTEIERQLGELAEAARPIGSLKAHPWRDSGRTYYAPRALEELTRTLDALVVKLTETIGAAADVERDFGLPAIHTLHDARTAAEIARVMHGSPGASLAVLRSDAWNAPPADATALIEAGRRLQKRRTQIDQRLIEAVLDHQHGPDIAYVEQISSGVFGFLAFLNGRYRAIKSRWMSYRKPAYSPSVFELATDLRQVDDYAEQQRAMEGKRDVARSLFGEHWSGERSDWDALGRYVDWVVAMRALSVRNSLSSTALNLASQRAPNISSVSALERQATEIAASLADLREKVEWPKGYLESETLVAIVERLRRMRAAIGLVSEWTTFEQLRQQLMKTAASELLAVTIDLDNEGELPLSGIAKVFRRAVLEQFLEDVIGQRPLLRDFRTLSHEQRQKEFRQLDERVLVENRARVVGDLRNTTQQRLQQPASREGLPFIQREMAKQRNIAPLRRILQQAESTVRAIKPCFLMSPLTVAQYLDGRIPSFDLVIFDEASQLPSEDAVGAISRGRQLVVVGDPKQLPPTNFFSASFGAAPVGEDGQPLIEDAESILEEFMGAGVPVTRLKWHYRSAHESLIAFSNVSFYDSDLYTFPSVETNSETYGLSFEYVEDGVYEGKGLNMAEARRVVDAVVRHAKERPHESLGVGTFNMRQQLAIQDELELRRREDPSIEPFFSRGAGEPFFVKNLENIQGDERDVIFLSVTYAKGPDGRLRYNFGPINGENGWRRLNVLTTRSRKRMRVFSSMRGDDINAAGTTSRGAHLLRDFLRFAEFGRLESVVANAAAQTESPFEQQVVSELVRRGVKVVPQVGVAGYRIDIGILDDDAPGRFVCGIECDGVAYHSAETARDRDRLRQQVLEARGWTIIRLWSTDWFKDRDGQINRLMSLIASAAVDSRERVKSDAEAEARVRVQISAEREALAEQTSKVDAEHLIQIRAAVAAGPYVRPSVREYQFATGQRRHDGSDFLETPSSFVIGAIEEVVSVESPVHVSDLSTRVAGFWGLTRVGTRINGKIGEGLRAVVRTGGVVQRGDFVWSLAHARSTDAIPVRSRSGTRIPGDRVPSEEIQGAIVLVLRAAGGLTFDELLSEVRQVLGVGKAGLSSAFSDVLKKMVNDGTVGEGSAGFALRGESSFANAEAVQ